MEYINRKSLIYKSGLGFYCINHALGCYHGCRYPCYAYMMAQKHGRVNSYNEWDQPEFVDSIYFSGWNYNTQVKKFPHYQEFYSDQASLVRRFCMDHDIQYS